MENTRLIWVVVENDRGFGTTLVRAYEFEEEARENLNENEYIDWVELMVSDPDNPDRWNDE